MTRIVTVEFHANAEQGTGEVFTNRFPVGATLDVEDATVDNDGFIHFSVGGREYEVAKQVFDDSTTEKTPFALI